MIIGSPRQCYAPLCFVLGVGFWSIKGGWRSAPCSASLQSNCLFPRRLSKKDDIYQNLLSGDLAGRERGRVYCLWKQAKKMRKTWREEMLSYLKVVGTILGRWLSV